MPHKVNGLRRQFAEDSADDQRVALTSTDEEAPRTVDLASSRAGTAARAMPGEDADPSSGWEVCPPPSLREAASGMAVAISAS